MDDLVRARAVLRPGRFALDRLAGWRADLAALLAGALAALALPPVFLVPVLLVSVPALLALIDAAPGWRAAARRGYWFGVGNFAAGLYWVTDAILVRAAEFWWLVPLAVPALALGLGAFVAAPAGLSRLAAPGWRRAVAFAGWWTLADLAREFALTGFPWNLWGSVWEFPGVAGNVMIQPAAWVGIDGLTLATLLLAATPRLGRRAMGAGAAGLVLWAGFGLVRLQARTAAAPGVTLVLVQGDVPETDKWDRAIALGIFRRYLELTRAGMAQAGERPASVVVWPESASPFLLERDAGARAAVAAAMAPARDGLIGSVRFGADGRPRNSLITVLPGGGLGPIYDKAHLVPFGEYSPAFLPVEVVPGGGFQAGPGLRTLDVAGLPPVGPLICYEAIFPGQVVEPGHRPAWLVNITNDAWFGDTAGPRQHLAAARMRAVEEGLPLARDANTGITAVFDAFGRQTARIGFERPGVLVAPLPGAIPPTPFARLGLAIPGLLAAAGIGTGIAGLRKSRRMHKNQ